MNPGFSIIHSNFLEDLRQVAVQWIRSHPLDPLENELFIVHSNGMAQWLKLALAENAGCGISAALDFQLPARFLWNAYRAVLGVDEIPRESPYDKVRLTWRLLQLLPCLLKDNCFAPLAQFLDDDDLRKRYQLACYLADLYDQYQVYRADWLEDWTLGMDQLRNANGEPVELPKEQAWQAELWRRIQADVPCRQRHTGRADLHCRFLQAVKALKKRPAALPRRVIVFGICSLPKQVLEALHAVSGHSQVLLFVHNPCRHYWADIIEDRELLRIERARHPRKAQMPEDLNPELLHQHVNPLLAAWGKQGRDYIGLLYGYDQPDAYRKSFTEIDLFDDFLLPEQPGSLLQQVQQAILDLQPLPTVEEEKAFIAPEDQSICFHLAHSRQREVEILQDRLLSFFERIPGLKPRDIIVMTPDIDIYAPHIEAVFGNLQSQDARFIPFAIADRPERVDISLLPAFEKLFRLPDSRLTVSDLIDLLDIPAFRERFGLAEADFPRLHQWIEGAGIRWGLSAAQRSSLGLPAGLEQNTWLFGLRRMLLGYAVGSGEPWQEIEPYDEVGGMEASLVGPLATILEKLEKHCRALSQPAPADDWCKRILSLAKDFFLPTNSCDQLTRNRLEEVLEQWANACSDAGLKEELTLPVVREVILSAMNDSGMSQRFLAGMVNFCTLMPMRAIPFKVVCLLGMNDDQYPRSRPPLDFDLMAGSGMYRPGDRSPREDDRYLFLEALLSAREKLYISYIGRSVRDNSERMPSVLVGQLRDYLAAGWTVADTVSSAKESEVSLLDRLTCRHPLQPFSKAYFQPQRSPGLFTYAHEWREILDQREIKTCETQLAAPQFEGNVQLIQLIRFLKNPVKSFFNQRLKVYFDEVNITAEDREPFTLDGLANFSLGMQLLNAGLAVEPAESAEAVRQSAERLRRTGKLPINGLGELAAEKLTGPVLSMLQHHHGLSEKWPHAVQPKEIRFPIQLTGCGCGALEDWLDGLKKNDPPRPASSKPISYARWEFYPSEIMDGKGNVLRLAGLIGPWVKHLAGCAQGMVLTSYLVAPDSIIELKTLDKKEAQGRLAEMIEYWWLGLQLPLPVTAKTALAYLRVLLSDHSHDSPEDKEQKAEQAARKVYQGDGYNSLGELGYDPYLARTYPDFNSLKQAADNLFATLARVLYAPLFEVLDEVR